ncbi:MAG TPA: DUF2239 family protein [Phenylobacterium sp.]|jgi:hypothetical protein
MEFAVFVGERLIGGGDLATSMRLARDSCEAAPLILESASGRVIEVDPRGSGRDEARTKPARGRPKLGVTAREVTLLPRHWDWLSTQPGGASAALRRLVDEARRETVDADARRQITEAVYRVATTLGGDRPGYEEAIRALFARDLPAFHDRIAVWPPDIAAYLRDLAAPLAEPPSEPS